MSELKIVGTVITIPVDQIFPNAWNPKESVDDNRFNKEEYEKLKITIANKGYNDYIKVRQVDGKYEIVDGFHRWKACKELGFKELVCINYGSISKEEAIGITLDTIYIRIPASEVLTAKLVKDLVTMGVAKEKIGPFDTAKIEEYLQMANYDWSKIEHAVAPTDEHKKVKCPNCGNIFEPNLWVNEENTNN